MNMRVLMFGWEFPPYNSGGLGVACKGLSEALVQQNVNLCFVLPKKISIKNDHLSFAFADDGYEYKVRVVNQQFNPYPQVFLDKKAKHNYTQDLIRNVDNYEDAAVKIAEEENHDVIHAHDWLSFGAGAKAKKISKKPLVAQVHATEFDRCGGNNVNEYIYKKEKVGLQSADQVITVSNYTKDIVVRKYGIDPSKISVVHNGVDIHELEIEETEVHDAIGRLKKAGKKIVLFVGRLTIQKNPEALLHAAKKALKYMDDVVFICTGAGEMQKQLIELSSKLGISDKILFTGFARDDERKLLFNHADLFVMPSVSEPFGLVSLEAMTTHTPVILSRQSGVSETLRNVLKVDFWDTEELANKIVAVLMYSSLQKTMQSYAYEEVKDYTWDSAAERCIDVYMNLLK